GDGIYDGHEIIAGTDPDNSKDALKILQFNRTAPDFVSMNCDTRTGRVYTLQSSTDLLNPNAWTNLYEKQGNGEIMTFTNNLTIPGSFYRIRVRDN
ncbi:MAG: hypothetical protein JXN60_06865, partial [Lentisphaerae bacterium]|nr:hypothetical protein [Lentisphaerota bacterium]